MHEEGTGAERIERAIASARERDALALVPFVTAGYPDRAGFSELVETIASVGDVVEIGVPFSDPMADGITIQRSSRAALEAGVTLPWILEVLASRTRRAPIVLMSYLNPLISFGIPRIAPEARRAGVSGFIVPDLPYEECGPLDSALSGEGLALVQLVTPVTPEERLTLLCRASRGFVYAVTVTGTTGGAHSDGLLPYLDRVRRASPLPVLAGFGIRSAEQLRELSGHADGGIVGSALIEAIERGQDPAAFLGSLRPPPDRTSRS